MDHATFINCMELLGAHFHWHFLAVAAHLEREWTISESYFSHLYSHQRNLRDGFDRD